jgi:hypothetical protein
MGVEEIREGSRARSRERSRERSRRGYTVRGVDVPI